MELVLRILKWLVLAIIVLSLLSVFYLSSKKPQRSGSLELAGLSAPVSVVYDNHGIPHITAENDEDMYLAFGYVHAQDRLFQMDMLRRLGQGRLAEWFGPKAVKMDRLFRTLQIDQFTSDWMARYRTTAPKKIVAAIDAYIAGVNAYIKHGPTPIEYALMGADKEQFTTNDMAAVLGFTGYSFTFGITQDVMVTSLAEQLDDSYIKDLGVRWQPGSTLNPVSQKQADQLTGFLSSVIAELNPSGIFQGSNGWAIAASKTKQGRAMLVNDPHMGFSQPSVWYEAELKSPESEIYGHHLALVPFAFLGHNQDVAWGLTMFLNDDVDLFKEKLNPNNPEQYWAIDEWREFETHHETIKVKGADDIELKLQKSRHGPIINHAYALFSDSDPQSDPFIEVNEPLAMWWMFYHPDSDIITPLYEFTRMKSPQQAEQAAAKLVSPGLNVMYADKNDNIAWWAAGKLIKRPKHVNSSMILDGASGKDDPLGYYDFAHNPKILNPERGYLFTSNNQPDDTGIGMIPGYYVARDRAQRINELLSNKDDWDVESTKEMLLDSKTPIVKRMQNQALSNVILSELSDAQVGYLNQLMAWNAEHNVDSIEPSLFYYFKKELLTAVYLDEMGEHNFEMFLTGFLRQKTLWKLLNSPNSPWWDRKGTENIETKAEIVTEAWKTTVTKVLALYNSPEQELQWKNVLKMVHQHPFGTNEQLAPVFNVGPLEAAGGNETINNMIFKLNHEPFITQHGPSTRRIVDFSNLNNSWGINPTGQSGVFNDEHYSDQALMYSKGEFRPQLTDLTVIKQGTHSVLLFNPKQYND